MSVSVTIIQYYIVINIKLLRLTADGLDVTLNNFSIIIIISILSLKILYSI
mgnify:FL=1